MTEQRLSDEPLAATATEQVEDDEDRQRRLIAEMEWIEAYYADALSEMRNR